MSTEDRNALEARLESHHFNPGEVLFCARLFVNDFNDKVRAKEVIKQALDPSVIDFSSFDLVGTYWDAAELAEEILEDKEFGNEIKSELLSQNINCGHCLQISGLYAMDDPESARAVLKRASALIDDSLDFEDACFGARISAEQGLPDIGLLFTKHCIKLGPTESYDVKDLIEALAMCGDFESADEWIEKLSEIGSADDVESARDQVNEIKSAAS